MVVRAWPGVLFAVTTACSHGGDTQAGTVAAKATAPATAPSPPDASSPALSEADRARLIGAIIPLIDAHYVFPDLGTKTIGALRDHAARGDYASITDGARFAHALTDDLRAVTHDKHFSVRYFDGAPEGLSKDEEDEHTRVLASQGFVSTERLPGNVALVRIDCFEQGPDDKGVTEAYVKRMTEVADASALLIDMRENHGGQPATIALFLSYLFDRGPVPLEDFWDRDEGSTWQSATQAAVGGTRFGAKKPVFVLTSKTTFSGGEEVAYDLQAMKRATVIGETTGGGANPAPRHKLDAHFVLSVPSARAINPITHTNWEGVGVVPDVPVAAELAAHEAHVRALRALIATATGRKRAELETLLAAVSQAPDAGAPTTR